MFLQVHPRFGGNKIRVKQWNEMDHDPSFSIIFHSNFLNQTMEQLPLPLHVSAFYHLPPIQTCPKTGQPPLTLNFFLLKNKDWRIMTSLGLIWIKKWKPLLWPTDNTVWHFAQNNRKLCEVSAIFREIEIQTSEPQN